MFKLPTAKTPILCQGITTELGAIHTERALAYGSHIVAGTARDKSIKSYQGIPIFSTVREAVRKTNPTVSVVFSSPARALGDVEEAIRAKIPLIICTTEHVPLHDTLKMIELASKNSVTLIGPSSPGIVRVGSCLAGSIPAHLFPKGNIGVIGRSSSLIYEAVQQLSEEGLGVSTCISLGAAPLVGTTFEPILEALLGDKETKAILIIGQLTGEMEIALADAYRHSRRKKPLVVYIPGQMLTKTLHESIQRTTIPNPDEMMTAKKMAFEKAKAVWVTNVLTLGSAVQDALDTKVKD